MRFAAFLQHAFLLAMRALLAAVYLVTRPSRVSLVYVQRYVLWHPSGAVDCRRFAGRTIGRAPHSVAMPTDPALAAAAADRLRTFSFDSAIAIRGAPAPVALDELLAESGTTAFLVISDNCLLHESYFNGHARETITRGYSITKSATSALVGIALEQGCLGDLDEPLLRYLPELAGRGYEGVTIRHLLLMTGGLRSSWARTPWSLGPLYYWHPDMRSLIVRAPPPATRPGERFAYNDCSTCMLGVILERATGTGIAQFFERWIWQPVGAGSEAIWNLDHAGDGLENAASGLNARAIDLARLASLYLNDGRAGNRQILPPSWIGESVSPPPLGAPGGLITVAGDVRYYKLGWWGHRCANGGFRYWAEGHRGQFLYCCPDRKLVIARFGNGLGRVGHAWPALLGAIANQFPVR